MHKIFKEISILVLVAFLTMMVLGGSGWGEENIKKLGSLKIFSKFENVRVYLDSEDMGNAPVSIDKIQAGSHFLQIISQEGTVFNDVINIKQGELTTILIPLEQGNEEVNNKDKEVPDYSKERRKGPFIFLGYASYLFGLSGSIGLGAGYQLGIAPHIDGYLLVEQGKMGSTTVMPISLMLSFSSRPNSQFEGKNFYGVSLNYVLGAIGYSVTYGSEFPTGKSGSFFWEAGYGYIGSTVDSSYGASTFRLAAGYRWNVPIGE